MSVKDLNFLILLALSSESYNYNDDDTSKESSFEIIDKGFQEFYLHIEFGPKHAPDEFDFPIEQVKSLRDYLDGLLEDKEN